MSSTALDVRESFGNLLAACDRQLTYAEGVRGPFHHLDLYAPNGGLIAGSDYPPAAALSTRMRQISIGVPFMNGVRIVGSETPKKNGLHRSDFVVSRVVTGPEEDLRLAFPDGAVAHMITFSVKHGWSAEILRPDGKEPEGISCIGERGATSDKARLLVTPGIEFGPHAESLRDTIDWAAALARNPRVVNISR